LSLQRASNKKFIKKVKMQHPWISHMITDPKIASDLNLASIELGARGGSPCLRCRGSRRLCGKTQCPAILKLYSFLQINKKAQSQHMVGSSPPGIFVGRIGYPHVYAGPLVPPVLGNTSLFNSPEKWIGKSFKEIISFRTNLIRGKFRVNVNKPQSNHRFTDTTLAIALSQDSISADITFQKKPSGRFLIDNTLQPMGPSALMQRLKIESSRTDHRLEKAYRDSDLKAEHAMMDLYNDQVPVSKIQRILSIGALGIQHQRKMVPTRWSITAVDSTISQRILEKDVKRCPRINEYQVYEFNYLGNRFVILLIPANWSYEWIEAWYPGTAWNPGRQSVAMGGDWESYQGRTTYASIGGCYYSVRLATAEFLASIQRQARVIALREIYPNFLSPLGVWINRESVRAAFRQSEVTKFNTLPETLDYLSTRLRIPLSHWMDASVLLKDELCQKKMTHYF